MQNFFAGTAVGSIFGVLGSFAAYECFGNSKNTNKGDKSSMSSPQQQTIGIPAASVVTNNNNTAIDLQRKLSEFGLPTDDSIHFTSSYASGFSGQLRTPRWVVEYIPGGGSVNGGGDRSSSSFFAENSIRDIFRATNGDYAVGAASGLSRGHLAPAQLHKDSQQAMNDTFNLSLNIVPQYMSVNCCDWFRLEQMVKKLSKKYDGGLWVVSGPAFVPRQTGQKEWKMEYNLVGEHKVAIPTHTYKVILGKTGSSGYHISSFLMPNGPIAAEKPLTSFQVPLKEVEALTGLSFFPQLISSSSSSLPDMCKKNTCEGSYGSFSQAYRHLSKMQTATSKAELEQLWAEAQEKGFKDAFLKRQYESGMQQLRQ